MLTMGPHLYYADPVTMTLKGEIPWSPQLRVEPKNFRIFFVHTVIQLYYNFLLCPNFGFNNYSFINYL